MPVFAWIILGVIAFLLLSFIGVLAFTWHIGTGVFKSILVRESPDKFKRECSAPQIPEHKQMFDEGLEWGEQHKDKMRDITVTAEDGETLAGQYFDFGSDRCALIISGRSENLLYSYYFAAPYEKAGCNIMVIDVRAHGNSGGKYCTVGGFESRDVLCWCRKIKELGNRDIVIHGICVGAASSVRAAAYEDCPDCISALVMEGVFLSFPESFKQHMITDGHPVFPVLQEVMFHLWRKTGVNAFKIAPEKHIDKVKIPMLFLHGKQDKFSLPKTAEWLYARSGAEKKKLVWFDIGSHSHLRIHAPEKYDAAIVDFLNEI